MLTRTLLALLGLMFAYQTILGADREEPQRVGGPPFPEVSLPRPAGPMAPGYLDLGPQVTFTLSDIGAEVVIVEILSTICASCLEQVGPYNDLFRRIEEDPRTRGRVKMLGVAVADTPERIASFRAEHDIPFPIAPDSRFALHRALGSPQAPYTLMVRLAPGGGPAVIAEEHPGVNRNVERLLDEAAALADLLPEKPGAQALKRATAPPLLKGEELQKAVHRSFSGLGDQVSGLRRLELKSDRRLFTALVKLGPEAHRYFAEVVDRPSICDICHDIHFIVLFNRKGKIIGFEPLHLTKYGNRLWEHRDVEQLRWQVMNRSLFEPPSFDPEVDAVTSATMTTAVIYDHLGLGPELMAELKAQGLLDLP